MEVRYLTFKGKKIRITKAPGDKYWRDEFGTILAIRDLDSKDNVTRCGVGVISLPRAHPLTDACGPHDYAYSSSAYQEFHTRKEADKYLENLIKKVGKGKAYGLLAKPFYALVRIFGGFLWENKRTR